MAETIGKFFCIKCGETTIELRKRAKITGGYSSSGSFSYTTIAKFGRDSDCYLEDEIGTSYKRWKHNNGYWSFECQNSWNSIYEVDNNYHERIIWACDKCGKKKYYFYDFIKDYPQILVDKSKDNNNINKEQIVEENNKLKIDMEQKNNEIQKLKSDITNYINENNQLKNEKEKLNSNLNDYIEENKKLKNINNELSNKLKLLESNNINKNLNNQLLSDNEKIISLMEELKIKDNKIKEINELKDLIPVIFQCNDPKITYSIICRKTDKFVEKERFIYEKFPELEENEDYEYYFTFRGKKLKKGKTMAENNINYSDIVEIIKIKI